MAADGRLSGPELTAPGGRRYAAGDRIVTLAPGADGRLVTSEQGRVLEVDPRAGIFTARMDDGRLQTFAPEETSADRLALGYAVTIHRSQGATVDTARRYEDGGGRELAYVAMSRARHSSHVYVVADHLNQAVEDLVRDWAAERRPQWAIDTGTPAPKLSPGRPRPSIAPDAALRLARLRVEQDAVAAAIPPDPSSLLQSVESRLADLRQARRQLEPGWAHYPDTLEGEVARALSEARYRRKEAEEFAQMDGMDWRSRRYWRRAAREWEGREKAAQEGYDRVLSPELERLGHEIEHLEDGREDLSEQLEAGEEWLWSHPKAARRLEFLDHEVTRAEQASAPSVADDLADALGRRLGAREPDLGLDAGIDFGP